MRANTKHSPVWQVVSRSGETLYIGKRITAIYRRKDIFRLTGRWHRVEPIETTLEEMPPPNEGHLRFIDPDPTPPHGILRPQIKKENK
jgi:hypothetical protein